MPLSNQNSDIELRSEEVNDILSHPPNWMIQWGNSAIGLVVILILVMSYVIKYPDIINGTAVISTENPPVYISSAVNGRIKELHTRNNTYVASGEILAEVNNPIPISSVAYLSGFIKEASLKLSQPDYKVSIIEDSIRLFDATSTYLELVRAIRAYHRLLTDPSYDLELEDLISKRNNFMRVQQITKKEAALIDTDKDYARERFEMQKKEYDLGYITKLNYLNAQAAYNQALKAEQSVKKSLIQIEISLKDYEKQIEDFKKNYKIRTENLRTEIETKEV